MLATIESIYYFYKEYQKEMVSVGQLETPKCADLTHISFDDLLFFYCLNLEMIIQFHSRNPHIVSSLTKPILIVYREEGMRATLMV